MRCLVTGCAGFIGSHLCDRLLADGHTVIGVDAFTSYYARSLKEQNLSGARREARFTLVDGDLLSLALEPLLAGINVVFHQAAQAGVRASWGGDFEAYTRQNVLATQRLLEACRAHPQLQRFVYASSSSIYGNARNLPMTEDAIPRPFSPYGVTKLAAEHLCQVYWTNFQIPTVALRYFTVYGARQRPDMAFHRFIRAAYAGESITIHEDGDQTRDFTHVRDIVQANILAAERAVTVGNVYNVAGGARVTLNSAIDRLAAISGKELQVRRVGGQSGDVRHTYADITHAREDMDYRPRVDLDTGLQDELEWFERFQDGKAPSTQ
jgi:nucleoside-diphosphate-sugar epimerase